MTSMGWRVHASTMPPKLPAMALTAGLTATIWTLVVSWKVGVGVLVCCWDDDVEGLWLLKLHRVRREGDVCESLGRCWKERCVAI